MTMTTTNNSPGDSQAGTPSYKEKLDQAAREAREREIHGNSSTKGDEEPGIVEKVVEYVPAAAKLLGLQDQKKQQTRDEERETSPPGPPARPDHDGAIEEFVRQQHLSKKPDGATTG